MAKGLNQTLDSLNFPISKSKKQEHVPQPKQAEPSVADTGLTNRFKESLAIPIQGRDSYWYLEDLSEAEKNQGMFSKLLKKKDLSVDEINDLKKEAVQSPGNTRTKIQKLKKQYPNNSELYMLSAICANGMLMNSSNRDEVLRGLKYAVKEAATALLSNGVSLYNCESFFKIYFVMLDRLRRSQAKTLGMLSEDPRLQRNKKELMGAIKAVEFMYGEKNKVNNIINHLKKKLKSSNYIALFSIKEIQEAVQHLEKGAPKEPCKVGTAAELISYIYAMTVTFAHTPLLTNLVDKIIRLFPDKESSLVARKISINSIRRFGAFKISMAEGDRDEMLKLANAIFKENLYGLSKLKGQAIYNSFEADLFFNLAYVAELTPTLYAGREYNEMAEKAIQAMEVLADKDMSKGHAFTENANNHMRRLTQLKDEKLAEAGKSEQ